MSGIFIWGTGCGAGELSARLPETVRIEAYVDSFPLSDSFMDRPVIAPEELKERNVELIIVSSRQSEAILQQAEALGMERERLLFIKNSCRLEDMNSTCTKAAELLGEDTLRQLIPGCHIVREPVRKSESPLNGRDMEDDYIRVKSLEAVARRIEHLPGAAAELGVYKGGFARCINALMPGRRLYLFDSFEGFESSEAAREKRLGNLSAGVEAAHRNTSMERVMALMPKPESVQLMPGYFPESLNGLEDEFAFVSLDADLEESTLAGLRYFVPRMVPGGYIFLHDYDSHAFHGVKNALERYEREIGRHLPAMPLCDINGTLVICM